jgi:oligoendopeptidase F
LARSRQAGDGVTLSTYSDEQDLQRWDLSRLYAAPDDPAIETDLEFAWREARGMRADFAPGLPSASSTEWRVLLDRHDALHGVLNRLFSYAYLLFSADTQSDASKNLYARLQGEIPAIQNEVGFIERAVQDLDASAYEVLATAEELVPYRDHLSRIRSATGHSLGELAERIITLKDRTGSRAWIQYYFETTADFRVRLGLDGYPEEMTLSEAHRLRESNERDIREVAHRETLKIYAQHARGLTFVFNALFDNYRSMMELRGYAHPFAPLLAEERLDASVIDTLLETVEAHYPMVQRYFTAKSAVMGITAFASHDLRAAYQGNASYISYAEGRDIVIDSLKAFSLRLGEEAQRFFDEHYIDAFSQPGKRAGAYCLSSGPVFHPYIFLNYNHTLKDVITMAHELGHGTHNVLVGEAQNVTNADRVTMFMETPSTFSETLTFKRLLTREVDPVIRQQLLGSQIEAAMLKVFKSVALTRFQLNVYQRRASSVLPAQLLCQMWQEQVDAMYGDVVQMNEWDRWEWLTFHHTLDKPFYDYAYSFGQLLVYALMRRYQEEGKVFEPRYLELLRAGTSITIGPLLEKVGVDLRDPEFWQKGLAYLDDMVSEFEGLAQM